MKKMALSTLILTAFLMVTTSAAAWTVGTQKQQNGRYTAWIKDGQGRSVSVEGEYATKREARKAGKKLLKEAKGYSTRDSEERTSKEECMKPGVQC